jgi:hypothetical protein
MNHHPLARFSIASLAAVFATLGTTSGQAQTAYGVSANGTLVRFDVATPGLVTSLGNLGFTPEGIDFRPSTSTLFAIDIGPVTSRLFTINLNSGAATPVGGGFSSVGSVASVAYDLTTSQFFGFDFNPKTLQADGSIRIRLTGSGGADLRLNSDTGGIAAVDGILDYPAADPNGAAVPRVTASAYINNVAQVGGTTMLFDIDVGLDALVIQNPPNNGQLNTLAGGGLLGVRASDVAGFDILTYPASGANFAYAALQLESEQAHKLFAIDLTTGAAGLIGVIGADVSGGIAIAPVPELSTVGAAAFGGLMGIVGLKRWRKSRTA